MRFNLLSTSVLLSVIAMNPALSQTRITLYSGDFDAVSQSYPSERMPGLALVGQPLERELTRGSNAVSLDRLPVAIDVGSVQLAPARAGVLITSQRYDFALVDQDQLLNQSIGQRVTVEQASGSEVRRFTGTLVYAGNGLTLRQDDGRLRVLERYDSFELERIPEGLSARPTLRWAIDSSRAGKESFQLDYATGGLAWQAEYLARLNGPDRACRMALSGAAQIVNRSGLDFPAAALTLVAGSPNQARPAAPNRIQVSGTVMGMAKRADAYESAPAVQDSGEYHAYPLRNAVDLPNGSVQRASLIDAAEGVDCLRRYEIGRPGSGYRPSYPQVHANPGEQVAQALTVLEFDNASKYGLGIPLPAGRVRVFQADASGESLLGEARLEHTAAGQNVRMELGEAFDLTARREATDFRLADDRLSLTETIEMTLSNAKTQDVTVRVHEALTRWQDWEILDASQPWEKSGAQSARFEVKVPAGGSAKLRYTARYRWPINVRP